MSFFVYIHTCPNGKKYIGVTTQKHPENRWSNGRGYKSNEHFYSAINKYGWENIEHQFFKTKSYNLMMMWERTLIYHHNTISREYGYNKSSGGENLKGFQLALEIRQKISNTKKGTSPWNKGKHLSDENKKKISESLKGNQRALGHVLSDESKKRMIEKLKGKKQSEETKQKRAEKLKGKKRSEETKSKMSKSMRGKNTSPRSEEQKRRISETMKLYWKNKREQNI